jgi:hypothetical protein
MGMMKRNLLDRLRDPAYTPQDAGSSGVVYVLDDWDVLDDAADEIERLNSALHEAMSLLDDIVMAYELPGDHDETDQAIRVAKVLLDRYCSGKHKASTDMHPANL